MIRATRREESIDRTRSASRTAMARIHPSSPGTEVSLAERCVFELLAARLPDDWVVLHGRRVVVPSVDRRPPVESEADFLVLDPARGVVVLEVKGGFDIGVDEKGWFSVDSRGNRKAIKEPAAQAQRVMHTMLAHLSRLRGNPLPTRERRMAWGVVFPDFEVADSADPGLPRSMLLDRKDLQDPRAAIERLFDAHGVARRPLTAESQRFLIESLRPCFLLMRPLASRIEQQEPALVAMTEEQVRVFESGWHQPRLSVRGVAGSGKTFVAMELARRLFAEGRRVLFLCFNAPLARCVAADAPEVTVRTFHALVWDCAHKAGLGSQIPDKPAQSYYEQDAPRLLEDALHALPDERYDAVLVDEGQDFRALWWAPVTMLLRDPDRSALHVFWDPDQDLHRGGPTPELGLFELRLDYNCRNTRRIAEYAARFSTIAPRFRPQAPEGDEVVVIEAQSRARVADELGALLQALVDEQRVETERIVVLTQHARERSSLRCGRAGRFALVELDAVSLGQDEVRLSTVHRFKGLEREVVVLCDVDPEDAAIRLLMHVGSTRARHALYVLVCREREAP